MNAVAKPGQRLPSNNHVLRHIKSKSVIYDPETGHINGCHEDAWCYREVDKEKLSVMWAEFFSGATFESIGLAIKAFSSRFTTRKADVFSISSVGSTVDIAKAAGYRIKVIFTPTRTNPTHSSITGGKPDPMLENLFAQNCKLFISNSSYLVWEASVQPDSPESPESEHNPS